MGIKTMRKLASSAKSLLAKHCLPGDPRTSAVLSIFDEMFQQHNGMLQMCNNSEFHGGIQQGRKLILNMYQGVWICCCATDVQFTDITTHLIFPRSANRMAHEIDASCRNRGDVEDLRKLVWCILAKYVNLELEQVSRHKTPRGVEPAYSDELVDEMAMTSTNCLLLLAETLLKANGHIEVARKIAPLWHSQAVA